MVRSVLDVKQSKPSNGATSSSKIDVPAVESDIAHELHYRLAAKDASDAETLYNSVAWSVHNRLLESFEQTHEYWK